MYYIGWQDKDKASGRDVAHAICRMKSEDVKRVESIFDGVAEMTTRESAELMLNYGRGKAIAYYECTHNNYWFDISLALNCAIVEND